MIKHVVAWLKQAYGEAEVNARCSRLPPNHHTRIFKNGFFSLSQVTGREHADICRILLGTIIDLPLQKNHSDAATSAIVRTVRALLDFAYLAQYPVHSNQTLAEMDDAL